MRVTTMPLPSRSGCRSPSRARRRRSVMSAACTSAVNGSPRTGRQVPQRRRAERPRSIHVLRPVPGRRLPSPFRTRVRSHATLPPPPAPSLIRSGRSLRLRAELALGDAAHARGFDQDLHLPRRVIRFSRLDTAFYT
jgi:hypothetical protein